MPVAVQQSLSVAANDISPQQLTDFTDERLRADAALAFYGRAAVVGLQVLLMAGDRILMDNVPVNAVAGTAVDVSTDQMLADFGLAGDKLSLRYRNTTGAAIVVQGMLQVSY